MNAQTTHRTLLTVVIVGLVAFLVPLADVIGDLNDWTTGWQQPAVASRLIWCLVSALTAVGASLGLDLSKVMRG